MSRYCVKCGKELHSDAVFCPHCGERVPSANTTNLETKEMVAFCSRPILNILKIFLYLMAGGLIFACMINGIAALVIGGLFFYHFTTAGFILLPTFLVSLLGIETLGGVPLVFAGITLLFIALLLIVAAVAVIRALYLWKKKNPAVYKNA